MTPLTPERRGARDELMSALRIALYGDSDRMPSQSDHGPAYRERIVDAVERSLPAIESEAVDRRLAELREAVEGLRWCSSCWEFQTGHKFPCLDMGPREPTINDFRKAVLALLTSDARDRSPE